MLDDLFVADNLRTLQDAAMRPPPVPKQAAGFSAWKTTTAAPRGVVAGGTQAGAFVADTVGAFGGMAAAAGLGDPLLANRGAVQKESERIQREGLQFDTGDGLRDFAEFLRPDAETAHTAERLVFDFARVATKAIGYSVATGNVFAGAALTGGDEGAATADDLKRQGVDLATRTKAGAVVGATTALGVALPMAGNTLAQTAGLVALGGPVSFMAQQQAVRSILESANYDKLAEQFDPLDPVGLAVSTLIPAGFGAWGLRSARARAARDAQAATARADAEFAAGPMPSEQTPVAAAVREATQEQVDAARVWQQAEQRRTSNPGRTDDPQAQQAHESALVRAEEQMARGERVSVQDVAPPWEGGPSVALLPSPAMVADTLRSLSEGAFWAIEGGRLLRSGTDTPGDGGMGGEVVGRTPWVPADEWFGRMRNDLGARGLSNQADIKAAVEAAIAGDPLTANQRRTVDWMRGEIKEMEDRLWTLDDADAAAADAFRHGLSARDASDFELTARAAEIDQDAVERAAVRFEGDDAGFMAEMRRIAGEPEQQAAAGSPGEQGSGVGARSAATGDAPPADARGAAAEPAAGRDAGTRPTSTAEARLVEDAIARQVDLLLTEQPDMLVMLDGMDAPRPLSEVMAAIKAEADEMVLDGDLMQTAAECALLNGV